MPKYLSRRKTSVSFSFLLLLAAVVALSISIPVASAAPIQSPATSGSNSWAYGGQVGATVAGNGPNGSYAAHFHYGWKVIFTLANTSNTTFQLEVQRTMGAALYAAGSVGKYSANLTITAWEVETGFANFTTTGTVRLLSPNATTVPALAMMNEKAWSSGNITEILTVKWNGLQEGYVYASVAAQASADLSFDTSLGLFPLSPYVGESWTSSSIFNLAASYGVGWHVYGYDPWGSYLSTGHGSPITYQGTGTIVLNGTENTTMSFNGVSAAVMEITLWSPSFSFEDHEGILLIPSEGDLFHSGSLSSSGVQGAPGSQVFGTDQIDVGLANTHREGVIAASSRYGSSSNLFGTTPSDTAMGINAEAVPSQAGTAVVQGYPIPVSEAQSWCFYNCPSQQTKGPGAAGIILVLVIAVVAVAIIVAAVGRRRRSVPAASPVSQQTPLPPPPPPPYAYPPPPGPFVPPPPPPSDGKDPVGFYW
jgi:hypothetical protein